MAIRSFFCVQILSTPVLDFIRRIAVALLIAIIFLAGIQLRRWIGDTTRHVRYQHDIVNGFYWGSEVLAQARRLSPDEASANSWPGFFRAIPIELDAVLIRIAKVEGFAYAVIAGAIEGNVRASQSA